MRNSCRMIGMLLFAVAAAGLGGCATQSALTPVKSFETQVYWELVDDVPATSTAPAALQKTGTGTLTLTGVNTYSGSMVVSGTLKIETAPATTQSMTEQIDANRMVDEIKSGTQPATSAATQEAAHIDAPQFFFGEVPPPAPPGKKYVRRERLVDPNQSTRFAYRTNYDYLYQHAMQTINDFGYTIDRNDFRQGVIISFPKPAAQIVEPWRPDFATATAGGESTVNSQRRTIRISIQKAPNTAFYEVSVQVMVERESNPKGTLAGAVTFRDLGTAFGRSPVSLGSDNTGVRDIPEDAAATTRPIKPREELKEDWYRVGRESALEQKILEKLFTGL